MRYLRALSLVALSLCAVACIDDIEPDDSDTGDVEPIFQKTFNQKTFNSIAHNALVTDVATIKALVSQPLTTRTFTQGNYDLRLRASDPDSIEFLEYLVSCALTPDQALKRSNPLDPADITAHRGALGFCPQWGYGPVSGDPDCTQRVSACILARVNDLEERVALSFRSTDDNGVALPAENPLTGTDFGTSALQRCSGASYGAMASCGWSAGYVGTCSPGTTVTLVKSSACNSDSLLDSYRVCDGVETCDTVDDGYIGYGYTCWPWWSNFEFTCPSDGIFTVMERNWDGLRPATSRPSASAGALFPAHEYKVLNWREGAFYGQMFVTTPGYLGLETRVLANGTGTIKEFSADGGATWRTQPPNDPDRIVYQKMFVCHSDVWGFWTAFEKHRVCAGTTGWGCAINWIGNCSSTITKPNQDMALVELPEGACAVEDAAPVIGDGDYDECIDPETGDRYRHPITTFLTDACVFQHKPASANVCQNLPLPPGPRPIVPRPIGGVLVNR